MQTYVPTQKEIDSFFKIPNKSPPIDMVSNKRKHNENSNASSHSPDSEYDLGSTPVLQFAPDEPIDLKKEGEYSHVPRTKKPKKAGKGEKIQEINQFIEENQVVPSAIKLNTNSTDEEERKIVGLMTALWEKWFPESPDPTNPIIINQTISQSMLSIENIIGLPLEDQLDQKKIEERYNRLMEQTLQVQTILGTRATQNPFNILLSKIYDKMAVVLEVLRVYCRLSTVNHTKDTPSGDLALFRFHDILNTPGNMKSAALKAYALNEMVKRRFRRYHGDLYEPVINSRKQTTCAWQKVISIKEFVWNMTSTIGPNSPWRLMASKGTGAIKEVIEYFKESKEPHIPYLNPDRHIFSFENGIYLANEMTFINWEKLAGLPSINNRTPAKHFVNQDFPDPTPYKTWDSVPTPNMDTIMIHTQKWSPQLVRWMWILLGRLLYDVREYDDWQVFPFLFGRANTGKSTIIQYVVRLFYNPEDIGILSNKVEDTFGFSSLANKFIVCADDMLNIANRWDQALMQTMLSGSAVTLAVKNKDPITLPAWKPPFIMSGNNHQNYTDNAGSFSRRSPTFEFGVKVATGSVDGLLAGKLFIEIPHIILKANMAYREEAATNGWKSLWSVTCIELITQRDLLMKSANSLVDFIQGNSVTLDPSKKIPFQKLWAAYTQYCKSNSLIVSKRSADQYKTPFDDAGIRMEEIEERVNWKGKWFGKTQWLIGVDLTDDTVQTSITDTMSNSSRMEPLSNWARLGINQK